MLTLLCTVALIFSSCGHQFIKSEEFLHCEQAFKNYLKEQAALATIAVAFGGSASGVVNADAVELVNYEIVRNITVEDSIVIFRSEASKRYDKSLKLEIEWMNACKQNFDRGVEQYYENREEARQRLEELQNGAKKRLWESASQYEDILSSPEKTLEELQEDALKSPFGDYSRYVETKAKVDDMVNRKQEIIDNWFAETKYYLSLDANKVLAKYIKITYRTNGDKEDKKEAVLLFNPDLTKVLEK